MTFVPTFKNINFENSYFNIQTSGWIMPSFYFNLPLFTNWTMPSFFNFGNFDFSDIKFTFPDTNNKTDTTNLWNFSDMKFVMPTSSKKTNVTKHETKGSINNEYSNLSKSEAYKKALNDTNLEKLTGGRNWSIAESSFITDIPFAKKGTGAILEKVASLIGENLVITSALGTGENGNPHVKGGYASHHNAENPKLDIRINGNGKELAQKLKNTGYFTRVSTESDHLDVQIDPDKFKDFDTIA